MPVRLPNPSARPIPASVAGVVAELELGRWEIVDRGLIADILRGLGAAHDADRVEATIDTLRRAGWLLPLRTRGVWEFAPAARSGAFRSGDPFVELRGYLTVHPEDPVVVAMESAAFAHALAEHPPSVGVVAIGDGVRRDGALREYRLVPLDLGPRAVTDDVASVPAHTVEALLVSMALKPAAYRDWPNVRSWLGEVCRRVEASAPNDPGALVRPDATGLDGCTELLAGAPVAAWARLAYFFARSGHHDAADRLLRKAPGRPPGPVYLGPRNRRGRFDARTRVVDSLLDVT